MRNRGGRPIILNAEVREGLIAAVRQGLTLKAACKCVGISYSTFANWRQKCRKLIKDGVSTEPYDFVAAIDAEVCQLQRQHRLAAYVNLRARDYRYGWKNPMRDEVKEKLRVKAYEQAVLNVMRRTGII
jgi:transposase